MFTARRLGGISAMSCPSIMMWPSVGTSRPASMRSNVVLPQPEGPSRREELSRHDVEADIVHRDR
mgnify:CR=1 FL=1